MDVITTIILAIIEGVTEFLPISSTGHMAVASAIMGSNENDPFLILFEIVIQLAAILAVVVLYWRRFFNFKEISFYIKLIVAVIPSLIVGALFKKHIEAVMKSPLIIAIVMLVGGIVLIFVDRWFNKPVTDNDKDISNKKAFTIGCFQVLSILFPGLSRSAATIIGGMQQKLTRRLAAEFSFYLAVPTMLAATVKSLWDAYKDTPQVFNTSNVNMLLLGCGIAFIVALLAIKFFIGILTKYGFRPFGWYRILLGIVLLVLIFTHVIRS